MHDLIVLGDLHLGRGRNPETGRFHGLEAFFYDDDFRRFCAWLCADAGARAARLRLVFAGDVFDLLRIEPDQARPGASAAERRFGPPMSPARAAALVASILGGHPGFVDGVAAVLQAGHEVVFLPGNHDAELQWAPVQAEVRRALLDAAPDAGERLRFEPWFHHEPGRIWIEHGSQYDPEGAFRFPLRQGLPEGDPEVERDMPLGNFFQRYLYNAFGPITFIVPSSTANARYLRWLILHRPRFLARVALSHAPFVRQLLKRLARAPGGRGELRRTHESELAALAARSGLADRLYAVDALKEVRGDIHQTLRQIGRNVLAFTGVALFLALLGVGVWFAGFQTIHSLRLGFGSKTLLFLLLNLLMLAIGAAGVAALLLRGPRAAPSTLPRAARRIVKTLDVPLVAFGHSHDEDVRRLERPAGGPAWYFNTGTWIQVFMRDVLLPRERLQFTFLCVRGSEGELLHWSPGRGQPVPVILLDDDPHAAAG